MDLRNSSFKLFLSRGATAGLLFVGITLFAQILEPSQLGSFFLFEALLGLLSIPADFGLRSAAEKRISEGRNADDVLTTVALLKLPPLLAVASGVIALEGPINQYVGLPVANLLVVALFLNEFGRLTLRVLAGELRVGETAALRFSRYFVWFVAGVVFVVNDFGALGLIYGLIIGLVVMLLGGVYKQSTSFGVPSPELASSVLSYSKFDFVSNVGGYFYSWIDLAIIGLFMGLSQVGAYEVAWRVAKLVTLLSGSIASAVFPQISQWSAKDETKHIESLLPKVISPALVVPIPAFFGMLLFSSEILTFVFGTEYAIAAMALVVLSGEKIFQSLHMIFGRALRAIDRPDLAARAVAVTILINIVLNVVLIQKFGLIGAATATAFAFLVNMILHLQYLSNFLSIDINYREIGWFGGAGVGMSIILFLFKTILRIEITSAFILFIFVISGATIYGGLVLLYSPIRIKCINYMLTLARGVLN